jgi:ribosomal protein S21
MAINVKMLKGERGDAGMLLKRFQKKVQESGVVQKLKSKKHANRAMSKLKIKKDKLVKLEAAKKYEYLRKMGKLQVRTFSFKKDSPSATTQTNTK